MIRNCLILLGLLACFALWANSHDQSADLRRIAVGRWQCDDFGDGRGGPGGEVIFTLRADQTGMTQIPPGEEFTKPLRWFATADSRLGFSTENGVVSFRCEVSPDKDAMMLTPDSTERRVQHWRRLSH